MGMIGIGRNAVRPEEDVPILQWANGKNEARAAGNGGTSGRFAPTIGWYTERGRFGEFDEFAERHRVPRIEMRHPRQGGGAQIVPHWFLGETVRFYPVTRGPVAATVAASVSPRFLAETIAAGIGVRWGRGAGERSRLAVRGFVALADTVGWVIYPRLVQVSVRSIMTDRLLAALIDHVRVCAIADGLVDRAKHPEPVDLHELALPLGPGAEEEWGRGETAIVTPLTSQHPQDVDLPYLRSLWRPEEVHRHALEAWAGIQAWAAGYYGAQGNGADHAGEEEPV